MRWPQPVGWAFLRPSVAAAHAQPIVGWLQPMGWPQHMWRPQPMPTPEPMGRPQPGRGHGAGAPKAAPRTAGQPRACDAFNSTELRRLLGVVSATVLHGRSIPARVLDGDPLCDDAPFTLELAPLDGWLPVPVLAAALPGTAPAIACAAATHAQLMRLPEPMRLPQPMWPPQPMRALMGSCSPWCGWPQPIGWPRPVQ